LRGSLPYVLFDSWYSPLQNLKFIASYDWRFLCRLQSNRQVNPDDTAKLAIREVEPQTWPGSASKGLWDGEGV
jgi:hypothetical protein